MHNGLCSPAASSPIGETFEEAVLPHLDAARRLARWLIRNEHDADDVVQEAALRAFRYFRTFTGGNARAWFLSIVRNSCRASRGPRLQDATDLFDEQQHSGASPVLDPETLLLQTDNAVLIERALSRLPARFRELLILRELQGLTYQELAARLDIPMGTVMSSLSRARHALRAALGDQLEQDSARAWSAHETADKRS